MTEQKDSKPYCAVCGAQPPVRGKAFITADPSTGKTEIWAYACDADGGDDHAGMVRYMLAYAGSLTPEERDGLLPTQMVRAALRIYTVFRSDEVFAG